MSTDARASSLTFLIVPIYLPTVVQSFAEGMLLPTLPMYAKSLTDSFSLVGLVLAAQMIGGLLSDLPVGLLLARYGARSVILAGSAFLGVAGLGFAASTHVAGLLGSGLLFGVGFAMTNVGRQLYITEAAPGDVRGRAFALLGGVWRVGLFVGPVLGGILARRFGFGPAFSVVALLALVSFVMVFMGLKPLPGRRPHSFTGFSGLKRMLRLTGLDLIPAGLSFILFIVVRRGRFAILPLYGAYVLGLDVDAVGFILGCGTAIELTTIYPAGIIMDRLGRKFAIVPSFLVFAAGLALIPLSGSWVGLALASTVIGIANGLTSGTMMTLGADLAPAEYRGEFLGFWRLIGDGGGAAGPIIVGHLAQIAGLSMAAFVLAGLGVVGAVVLGLWVRETRAAPAAGRASGERSP